MQAVWMTHRSMTADPSVKEQKLKAGTVKRIFDFARPYRKYLSVFLFTVATKIKVMTLLKTPDRDDVNACCAPITSELIREIKAPV